MVRKELGARAFGFNHSSSRATTQASSTTSRRAVTRVFVVLSGAGRMRIDGEDVEVREGSFVRIDPDATRCPYAGPDGMSFLVIGAPVERPYEPPSWG